MSDANETGATGPAGASGELDQLRYQLEVRRFEEDRLHRRMELRYHAASIPVVLFAVIVAGLCVYDHDHSDGARIKELEWKIDELRQSALEGSSARPSILNGQNANDVLATVYVAGRIQESREPLITASIKNPASLDVGALLKPAGAIVDVAAISGKTKEEIVTQALTGAREAGVELIKSLAKRFIERPEEKGGSFAPSIQICMAPDLRMEGVGHRSGGNGPPSGSSGKSNETRKAKKCVTGR